MGQEEIIQYLNEVKGEFKTARQIAEYLNLNPKTVMRCMPRVIKRCEIVAIYVRMNQTKRKIWMYGVKKQV